MGLQTFFDNFTLLADAPNGVQKLRQLILQLAFRGMLVPQYPNEGSASLLVEQIDSVKSKLQKEGLISKQTASHSIDEEEKQHEIPTNWQWVRLGEIVAYDNSQKVTPSQIPNDAWLLELEDIEKDSSRIIQRLKFEIRESKSNKTKFAVGDVLYGKLRPYLNKVVVADNDGYCTTEIVTLRGYFGIEPKFLMYALKRPDFIAYINAKSYGVKMPRLGSDDARQAVLPLPPVEEQKRIVAKVDELMRLCDELGARQNARDESRVRLNNVTLTPLNNAGSLAPEGFEQAAVRLADNFATLYRSPETVSKLRSTILQLAVQGKLVRQQGSDEPAQRLVARIAARKSVRKQSSKAAHPQISIELIDSLPNKWVWATIEEVASDIVDCPHSTPKFGTGKYACVDTTCIKPGQLVIEKLRYVDEDTFLFRNKRLVPKHGDVVFAREATVGTAVSLPASPSVCLGQRVMLIRPDIDIHSKYLEQALSSIAIKKQYAEKLLGSTVPHLNVADVKRLYIPIPPLEEQKRIVAKLKQLMALCDELEAKLRQAETDGEKLMNAAVQHVLASLSETSTKTLARVSA